MLFYDCSIQKNKYFFSVVSLVLWRFRDRLSFSRGSLFRQGVLFGRVVVVSPSGSVLLPFQFPGLLLHVAIIWIRLMACPNTYLTRGPALHREEKLRSKGCYDAWHAWLQAIVPFSMHNIQIKWKMYVHSLCIIIQSRKSRQKKQ